jgi:hypothetical protein
MFYNTPPAPPLPVPIYQGDDCKKGSRDCFPENTQGGAIQDQTPIFIYEKATEVSLLISDFKVAHPSY